MTVANFAEPPPPPPEPVPCWPTAGDFKKAFVPLVLTCVPISLDPIHGDVLTSEWHVVRKYWGDKEHCRHLLCAWKLHQARGMDCDQSIYTQPFIKFSTGECLQGSGKDTRAQSRSDLGWCCSQDTLSKLRIRLERWLSRWGLCHQA